MVAIAFEVNQHYKIVLEKDWKEDPINIFITGICSKSNVPDLDKSGKADIYKDYFEKYGLNQSVYNNLVTDNTLIYVGKKIKSLYPVEVSQEDEDTIFVPESIINYSKSYKYTFAVKYDFTLNTGLRTFDNITEENKFIEDAVSDIKKVINDIKYFSGDDISVDYSRNEILTTKSELESILKNREISYDAYESRIRSLKLRGELLEQNMLQSKHNYNTMYKSYQKGLKDLDDTIRGMHDDIENAKKTLNAVNEIKKKLSEFIIEARKKYNLSQEDLPSFETMWNQIFG